MPEAPPVTIAIELSNRRARTLPSIAFAARSRLLFVSEAMTHLVLDVAARSAP
jgi:hypothetical protein